MVVMDGVGKLMHDDVIYEAPWQLHQEDVQSDITFT